MAKTIKAAEKALQAAVKHEKGACQFLHDTEERVKREIVHAQETGADQITAASAAHERACDDIRQAQTTLHVAKMRRVASDVAKVPHASLRKQAAELSGLLNRIADRVEMMTKIEEGAESALAA
jgi:hypothetical protein